MIEPSEDTQYGMPTVPGVPSAPGEDAAHGRLSPSETVALESVLMAAKAEADRGEEEDCFERLQEAKQLVQRQDG